jgi:tRNA U34 5-methylaminomethyl-2-thiouridine-forming methyltransferase MnmC
LERKIITTGDGSVTIHIPEWNEQYHSKHGAIQEALHVFIKMGLNRVLETSAKKELSILEIGFGTGLNAFITYLEAAKNKLKIKYTGVEAYPVTSEEISALNYAEALNAQNSANLFEEMHSIPWESFSRISPFFDLKKQQKKFHEIEDFEAYDLIYFDAFGARVQPELWTEEIFSLMYRALKPGGVLVTYAAKGSVRRALQKVNFTVERLPGPPNKREMLRATKN